MDIHVKYSMWGPFQLINNFYDVSWQKKIHTLRVFKLLLLIVYLSETHKTYISSFFFNYEHIGNWYYGI